MCDMHSAVRGLGGLVAAIVWRHGSALLAPGQKYSRAANSKHQLADDQRMLMISQGGALP